MGFLKKEDVKAIVFRDVPIGTIYHPECLTEEQLREVSEGEVVTGKEMQEAEKGFYFCDKCGKLICKVMKPPRSG